MRKTLLAALAVLIAVPAFAAEAPKTEEQKTLYAVGLVMARQLSILSLTPEELEMVKQGMTDGVTGKAPLVDVEAYKMKINQFAVDRRNAEGKKLAAKSQEYIDKAAKEKGAVKTASGLVYQPIKEGAGDSPKATDKVQVNYKGTLIDGKEFDSSYSHGQPVEFQLDKVIKCWTEGVQMMKPGGKAKLVCPPQLAYGENAMQAIPPNSTLVFEVELIKVLK
ncbi:FKBP-type peptidyl-prolyl cis-trans isomerase [Geomonas sp.]|uniref:FKBP-type peptidyl-prolyl cis-trans isomerase n=1 Tax=Geomonas sp. TaxID=2651584 RepID=UPI002B46B228|nr:FKBP-type peptidyl-prolyl cis-trans isomerase [Geomonas sp.]HJV36418.1 FKBP-type peptidyl-prolyl cis-trans isomerase [Geomonas sp.]